MINYRVRWVQDGRKRTLAVSYDLPSAEDRRRALEAEKVQPGQ
ncbi:hypothetical protein AB0F20_10215 [Streptomyces goshikiensis]